MDFIYLGNILIALGLTLVLIVCHFAAPFILGSFKSPFIKSFAGGTAVGYAFLHMLPELVEGKEAMGRLLMQTHSMSPLEDLGIFIVALLGFQLYLALEVFTVRRAASRAEADPSDSKGIYYLHLGMYAIFNFLVTYTMPLRVQTGLGYSLLFVFAIGLHFMMTDLGMSRYFSAFFTRSGRIVLLAALFLGWGVSAVTDPIHIMVAILMVAFLSGAILYTVFREELSFDRDSSFTAFSLGIVFTTVLLVILSSLKTTSVFVEAIS